MVPLRLFETLSQFGALWVFLASGMILGVLESLWLLIRRICGDPVWLRIFLAIPGAAAWLVLTLAAVFYSYPYGLRFWQLAAQFIGCQSVMKGPADFILRRHEK